MKKIITLITGILLYAYASSQCTTTGFDVCAETGVFVTNFNNPVQVAGTGSPLTVGAKYKFHNISPGIDGIVSIDKMVNAVMTGAGVSGPDIDDDNAVDETGVPGSQAALFAPRIASDVNLTCSNRTGYVQFSVSFYVHTAGNSMPSALLLVPLANPNFLHFDMDGHTVGNNGYFREIGYVQRLSTLPLNPVNIGGAGSLLNLGALLTDAEGTWIRTNGASEERPELSRCAQVIEKSLYVGLYTSVSFRFGYEYKAPSNCASQNEGRPTRQYGSKFGCFTLAGGSALPVSLTDLLVNYNKGSATVNWTTLQEHNIRNYVIERSTDAVNFEAAGIVESKNSSVIHKYSYTDMNIPSGAKTVYYRIRIMEMDQTSRLTHVVAVKIASMGSKEMVITPNPASYNVQVKFNIAKSGSATITIYDASGKMVMKQLTSLMAGNNSIPVDISTLGEGIHIVKVVAGEEAYTSKLVISK